MFLQNVTLSTTDKDPYWNRYYVTFPVSFSKSCFVSFVQLRPTVYALPNYTQHISVEYRNGKSDILIPSEISGSSKITLPCIYKLFYIGY